MHFIIYGLLDPKSHRFRYIGKSYTTKRMYSHLRAAQKGHQSPCSRWIEKRIHENLTPKLVIIEECDESISNERERFWIAHYRNFASDLLNLTEGGDGCTGYRHPPEVRARISVNLKGRVRSPEHKKALGDANRGKKRSAKHVAALVAAHKGVPHKFSSKH